MKEMDFEGMASKLANIPDSSVVKKIETTARIFGIEHKENYICSFLHAFSSFQGYHHH